jgi:hypothetical protein
MSEICIAGDVDHIELPRKRAEPFLVVIFQNHLIARKRRLRNGARLRVFIDEREGEHVAVPMRQRQIQRCRSNHDNERAVLFDDLNRPVIVVVISARVGGKRARRQRIGGSRLADERPA